jgi:hypothetical protein
MNSESVGLIVAKLEQLITVAAGKVEAVYPVIRQQALIAGYLSLFGVCLAIVAFVTGLALVLTKGNVDDDHLTVKGVFVIVSFATSLISIMASTAGDVTFLAIINPDFYAIKLLLKMIQ